MSSIKHAETELRLLLESCEPEDREMQEYTNAAALEVIKVLASQGHSGYSIGYVVDLVRQLAQFKPLTPLTGEASEWMEVGDCGNGVFYQNVRCSSIFKDGENGQAYRIDGRAFSEVEYPNSWFTTGGWGWSKVPVDFPYNVPNTVYVSLDENCVPTDPVILAQMRADAERFGVDLDAQFAQRAADNAEDRKRREQQPQVSEGGAQLAPVLIETVAGECTCPSTECTRGCGNEQ